MEANLTLFTQPITYINEHIDIYVMYVHTYKYTHTPNLHWKATLWSVCYMLLVI